MKSYDCPAYLSLRNFFDAALSVQSPLRVRNGAGEIQTCETPQQIWDAVECAEEGYVYVRRGDEKATFWIIPENGSDALTDYSDNEFAEEILTLAKSHD